MKHLYQYGWNSYIKNIKNTENIQTENIGRVVSVKGNIFEIITGKGMVKAELPGKILFTYEKWEQPKVGDWIEYIDYENLALISDVLPRLNQFYRKTPGKTVEKQVIAANIDQAVVIQGLDNDFNPGRIERYLVQIAACKINPVIILNKSDLIEDEEPFIEEIKKLQRNIPVYFCSVKNLYGLEELKAEVFTEGTTSVLVGSSGVGKSSLVSQFTGNKMRTSGISNSTGKGKHTTTTRDLFLLDNDSIVIDTPGMREFGVGFESEAGFDEQFPAISKFASGCKYQDCSHVHEEGCKVIEAINSGELEHVVYRSYLKLVKEQNHFKTSIHEKKKQGRQFGKMVKEAKEYRKRYKW